ncbi:zinc finger CCHC domain-containing protein 4 [Sesbania bispinosa]|nr:zinc finger CCHC domain-containing protein 4 [Sesbania bispinosa]
MNTSKFFAAPAPSSSLEMQGGGGVGGSGLEVSPPSSPAVPAKMGGVEEQREHIFHTKDTFDWA